MGLLDFLSGSNGGFSYEKAWEEVEKSQNDRKINESYNAVKEILSHAKDDHNYPQIIKTFIFSLDYQNEITDDGYYKELELMEKELDTFPTADKAVMHSVLGDLYLNYLEHEYYMISDRTDVNVQDGNVATYSTKQLLRVARQHFIDSIKDIDELSKRKTSDYKDILSGNSNENSSMKPTLYDFLAHRALDNFFAKDITKYEVFDDNFDTNNIDLLKPQDEFLSLSFDGSLYEKSAAYKTFLIYQNLISIHKDDVNKSVLVFNDLKRLNHFRRNSVAEDKNEVYLDTLDKMEQTYADHSDSRNKVWYEKTKYFYYANKYVSAISLAQKLTEETNNPFIKCNVKTIIQNIENHELNCTSETYVPTDTDMVFKLTHKNIDKVYLRIGKITKKFFDYPKFNRNHDQYLKDFANEMTDCKDYAFNVEKKEDYTSSKSEVRIPGQKLGYYVVMISDKSDFHEGNTSFHLVQITDLSAVISFKPGETTVKILDRTTGLPEENTLVKIYNEQYINKAWTWVAIAEQYTDKDGNALFKHENINVQNANVFFTAKKDDDFFDRRSLHFQYANPPKIENSIRIFTDRALYRPGQTVYFKGVYFLKNGNQISVRSNEPVTIQVTDINRQIVYQETLTTNEYGSFSGSFKLGTSVVLGNYRFNASGINCYHSFSVEEYKRPTFEVFTDNVKDEIALNQDVTITGNAKTYSGVNVENAEVKYEVIRSPRFRGWWSFGFKMSDKSIANGIVKTDADGKFSITFKALPDKSLPMDLGLTFSYTVKLDVTSPDGETQQKNAYLSVGYAGIFLERPLHDTIYFKGRDKFKEVSITATNASGENVDCDVEIIVKKLKNFTEPDKNNNLKALEDDETLKSFSVKSNTKTDLSFLEDYADGNYCIRLETKDAQGHDINSESRFTLISEVCQNVDFNKYFWFDNAKTTCKPGETAKFIFGTSQTDVLLWYEIFQGELSLTGEQRFTLSKSSKIIEFPIVEANRGGISIRFFFVKNNQTYSDTCSVTVPFDNKVIKIQYESFRDKLEPGEKETVRLKIIDYQGNPINAELLATLYDESLDAIRSNPWYLALLDYNACCHSYTICGFQNDSAQNITTTTTSNLLKDIYDLCIQWFEHKTRNFGRRRDMMLMARGMGFGMAMSSNATGMMGMMSMNMASPMASQMASMPMMKSASVADNAVEEAANDLPFDSSENKNNGGNEDFDAVKVRENFSELAFFEPHLVTDAEGNILIEFTIPESLTKWHFKAFAHTKDMRVAFSDNHLITQKTFMVVPNLPRFFMEGDEITIPVKISNLSDKNLDGKVKIAILDAETLTPVSDYKIDQTIKDFAVEANHTTTAEFTINIPKRPEPVVVKIVGVSNGVSDGSQKPVPVLTTRTLITESQSFNIRANQTKIFTVNGLKNQSETQDNQSFTFEFTSNPAWFAFMSLPSLRETTSDNLYSIMAAFYSNSIARKIITSNPGLEETYNQLSEEDLKSALEKNQELKSILLNETPWLLDAKNESDQMKKLAHLFNKKVVDDTNAVYLKKLKEGQYSDGGWPWINGMKQSDFTTGEILIDLGRLIKLGAIENPDDLKAIEKMTALAVGYIDKELVEEYNRLKKILKEKDLETYSPGYYAVQYFYARSFFTQYPVPQSTMEAYNFYAEKIEQNWTDFTMYGSALIATTFNRLGRPAISLKIIDMLKDNAQNSEELGMYYSKKLNGYHWYNSPIETQAMIIEAFAELQMAHEVEELKIWLIKNKQTNSWKSSRATVEAVYALLMRGESFNPEEKPCTITIGGKVLSESSSKGAAYIKKKFPKDEISMQLADIQIVNPNNHIAFGASYIQYFEEYENVRTTANGLTLKKELYLIKKNEYGEDIATLITPETPLHPGDKIKARFVMTTDRDMEFVFLKDNHSAAFEPTNKLSGMRHQDTLWYYESTKDAAEEFFIEFMDRGTYVFEYQLFAVHKGILTNGIATVECMYAPEFRANSTSQKVKII